MRKPRIAAAVAIVVGLTTMIAAPAQAHTDSYSTSFVDGDGAISDDWGDHRDELGGDLCQGCSNSSNTDIVILWQSVLAAEGLLPLSGVDGYFGSNTKTATENWQDRYGLTSDGRVGRNTWNKADDQLRWSFSGYAVRYEAGAGRGDVFFTRGSGRAYVGGSYELDLLRKDSGWKKGFSGSHHVNLRSRSITIGATYS
jgi:peptidoglycan hydrolase-like protein with peptidoglycan-binding domain